MNRSLWICRVTFFLLALNCIAVSAFGQAQDGLIPDQEIASLEAQLDEAKQASSSARKKLAIRRLIRACESLLEKGADAPNRFEVLGILFHTQQQQVQLDDSDMNRRAFLKTAEQLAAAPKKYAAIRLDADLLLSQAELAQQGADLQARAEALKPLVDRYQDTEVQAKVIRIAMLMAIELGDAGLIQHLRQVIAERMPGDMEMINFQRDHLAGQVFGAPFVGHFKGSDGKAYRLPMDGMGKTTALYFWSKEDGGVQQLKDLIEGWSKVSAESDAQGRYQFISFNLDGLPDAGESILREVGLDWPALHLPGGRDNPIYKTYVRNDPKLLTMTPTGYTAMVMSGVTRPGKGWERSFQSGLARSWSSPRYVSQMQSLLIGEFMVIDPTGDFDPAAPPEWKAALAADSQQAKPLTRTDQSVPADELHAIQACFVKPPMRFKLTSQAVRANYAKAEQFCAQVIAEHPEADDLWIVRNRRIVALMGLWKIDGKREHFDAALQEAKAAKAAGYPAGTDVVARFCLARQALRSAEADFDDEIRRFVHADGDEPAAASVYAAAALLALDVGDRQLHEQYRRASLDQHADEPALWNATSFLLNRYHRYWLYHPPFTAGWTYGRRQGHFLAIGTPEDAHRTLHIELKTLAGETIKLPEDSAGKWTVIHFIPNVDATAYASRYGAFIQDRPFDDVNLIAAVLDDDADAVRKALQEKKKQDDIPIMLVPDGLNHPVVQQLGILDEETRPNIVLVRPDGNIAAMLSGLTMSSQNGNAMQNVIEWYDEQAVDEALARGDLEEAKRLAFTFAPIEEPTLPGQKRKAKKNISVPHLRSRAKVYAAMEDWQHAFDDAQAVYLEVNKKAGWLSMRTADLEETERLRDRIKQALDKAGSAE